MSLTALYYITVILAEMQKIYKFVQKNVCEAQTFQQGGLRSGGENLQTLKGSSVCKICIFFGLNCEFSRWDPQRDHEKLRPGKNFQHYKAHFIYFRSFARSGLQFALNPCRRTVLHVPYVPASSIHNLFTSLHLEIFCNFTMSKGDAEVNDQARLEDACCRAPTPSHRR